MSIELDLARWRDHLRRFAELLGHPPDRNCLPNPETPAGHCLIFAPHPDDECIVGALPLRLRQEAGWRITNVAVTLGSKQARRQERWDELLDACDILGFECVRLGEDSLSKVHPETAELDPEQRQFQVDSLAELLALHRPALVLAPHALDDNPTHLGVHQIVTEAIARAGSTTVLAATEFWSTQAHPNLLVQTHIADTARLLLALEQHRGEVARNPYHLRLPAFMADAVRRGGELVNGAGEAPPDFAFATLYRLTRFVNGEAVGDLPRRVMPADQPLGSPILEG